MSRVNTANLLNATLNVVNQALHANSDHAPYRNMLSAVRRRLPRRPLGVAICEFDPSRPVDWVTIVFLDDRFEILEHGLKEGAPTVWTVPRRFMEEILEHPRTYIEHPERLDWQWLIDVLETPARRGRRARST